MAMSGIKAHDDCKKAFEVQKIEKHTGTKQLINCITYKIADDDHCAKGHTKGHGGGKEIKIENLIGRNGLPYCCLGDVPCVEGNDHEDSKSPRELYDQWRASLPETEARYYTYDVRSEDDKVGKICFIAWVPEGAKVKEKMVAAASKDALSKPLSIEQYKYTYNDASDIPTYDELLEKVKSKS